MEVNVTPSKRSDPPLIKGLKQSGLVVVEWTGQASRFVPYSACLIGVAVRIRCETQI